MFEDRKFSSSLSLSQLELYVMVCIKQLMLVFQDSNNSQRKDLCLMGTNARVSGLRILHADTPAYSS